MLAALAQQRALTRDHLTALFFGSKRRCQAALAQLKQLGLIRPVVYLPQPMAGAGPRAYILTTEGARVAAQVTGMDGKALGLRAARTGRSFLHINHTLAINNFYVQLVTAIRGARGRLIWMSQDEALTAYTKNGKPTLTPDGQAEVRLGERIIRAYIEVDRGTERRHWLEAKFERYLRHQAGRVGADQLHILFIIPSAAREATFRNAAASSLRWAYRPTPGFWATTTALLAAHGPLGPAWARLPGNGSGYRYWISRLERATHRPTAATCGLTWPGTGLRRSHCPAG